MKNAARRAAVAGGLAAAVVCADGHLLPASGATSAVEVDAFLVLD